MTNIYIVSYQGQGDSIFLAEISMDDAEFILVSNDTKIAKNKLQLAEK